MTIKAATEWKSNAELIADVVRLGYLRKSDRVLDPTYGRGVWWKLWKPTELVTNDVDPKSAAMLHDDFRHIAYDDESFDAIAFDPPYVCVGGRKTSTLPDFQNRYGIDVAPKRPAELQELICCGLKEMHRLVRPAATRKLQAVRPNGIVLVKCQDYVSGGKLFAGTHFTLSAALDMGFELYDRLEHISDPRPQPVRVGQQHARRNLSTMFVLRRLR